MARKKKNKDLDEEYEYEDEYEDDKYDDEYEDDYDDEDYDDYDDEPRRRNPLRGVVVVLVLLLLLMAAAGALLYLRMQTAEDKVEQLTTALNATQTELNRLQAEAAAATPAPAATPVPEATAAPETGSEAAPEATPEPTPEVTPEPTPEPTPEATPVPAVTVPNQTTDEMLAGVTRPQDASWFDTVKTAWANSYMVAAHWGPGLDWMENMVLYQNDKVDILAWQQGWTLVRNQNGKYGWVLSTLLTETDPT